MAEVVADKVVEEVVGSLLTKVKKEIGYMCNCKENVKKLRSEVDKLENMKKTVELQIKSVKDNADALVPGVEKWVDDALAHISKTEEFLQEEADAKKTCFNLSMCVNPNTLRHYGKHAAKRIPDLEQQQKDGEAFKDKISIHISKPSILALSPRENFEGLDTHASVIEKIIDSVNDKSTQITQITGVWGMGGVGKTTIITEVAARVKDLFADVVLVTVTEKVGKKKVQARIQKEVANAAKRVTHDGEKVLIILDDVWTKFMLHEVGIPCGTRYPSCKILLTSRQKSVCTVMEAGTIIAVQPLPIEEALALFKRVVGENCDNLKGVKVVREDIINACGGLPLLIQAAGNALKNEKNIKAWERARDSIKKHLTLDIDGSVISEFALLRLSYDRLHCKEAKSIFLLCCVLPEDYHISLEKLAHYRVGFRRFFEEDSDRLSLEDARDKVQRAVTILKSSCLLLDGEDESTVKMHDVVRQVGLLIASRDKKFWVEAGKNLIQENYNLQEISDEFFRAMKAVQVIDFQCNDISYLAESLKQLTELCMINLGGNRYLRDVSILGDLGGLEILILNDTGITEIPQEIEKLDKLKLLRAARCPYLSHIAPGVLSKLSSLEELSIGYHPAEVKANRLSVTRRVCGSTGPSFKTLEIGELKKLTYLRLWVPHICLIPEGDYLKRLKTFCIQIGGSQEFIDDDDDDIPAGNKTLILDTLDDDISHLMHLRKWIEVCNDIVLRSINNLDKIRPMVMYCEGFGFKTINIGECANLLYLVDSLDEMQTSFFPYIRNHKGVKENILSGVEEIILYQLSSLKGIWNCRDTYISLNNLAALNICECLNLKKLFSVSVAQGLHNLKELSIEYCDSLEEVISDGKGEASTSEIETIVPPKKIVFDCLAEIQLIGMKSLESFYPGNDTIEYPSLVKVVIWHCNNMGKWGTHDTPNPQFVEINGTKVNGSKIDETLVKNREAHRLKKEKQRHGQRLVTTEEGPSSVGSSKGEE